MPLTWAEQQLARQTVAAGGQTAPPAPSALGTSSSLPGSSADLSNNSAASSNMGDTQSRHLLSVSISLSLDKHNISESQ